MDSFENILSIAEQAEVPAEMAEKLAAMSSEAFRSEVNRVIDVLSRGEVSEQERLYAFAIIREEKRREALLLEKRKALEEEIAEKKAIIAEKDRIIAGLQQMHDYLQMRVDEMESFSKVGRNDPCPCGSGKKYKHCCGKN